MANEITQHKIKDKFIQALLGKTSGNISQACQLVGRSRQAVNEWRKNDNDFDMAVQKAVVDGKEDLSDLAEDCLKKRIQNGDTTAIIFTLKSLKRDYYGEYRETKINLEQQTGNTMFEEPRTAKEAFLQLSVMLKLTFYKAKEWGVVNEEQSQTFTRLCELITNKSDNIKEDDKS